MPDWKIDKRKARCGSCDRDFESREEHYSAIVQNPEGFQRRDFCIRCWDGKSDEPFSYWRTESPEKQERRLENVQAMIDFFCRLTSGPLEDGTRRKVTYLVSLLLLRRRRLKLIRTASGKVELEKAWDGETITIPDPVIAEEELEGLKQEMEQLFLES